jgi:hypothetical protein
MTTNERAGLTNNAWVKRINELRNDLEDQYSAFPADATYAEAAEWMLSVAVDVEYDLDDADFLRREASRLME